jgi:hypothetical protein
VIVLAMVLGLGLAGPPESSFCRNPPSRASEAYWDYITACGCARLEARLVRLRPVREGVQRLAAAQPVVHGERGRSIPEPKAQSTPSAERFAEGVPRTVGAS